MLASKPADPQPMTAQDLDDWCAAIDARAQADQGRGVIRKSVLSAGQAAVDVTSARRRPVPAAACRCPVHPYAVLVPFPGGGARGSCPVDSRSHQMTPPEFTP
jgi:hypothetical protein